MSCDSRTSSYRYMSMHQYRSLNDVCQAPQAQCQLHDGRSRDRSGQWLVTYDIRKSCAVVASGSGLGSGLGTGSGSLPYLATVQDSDHVTATEPLPGRQAVIRSGAPRSRTSAPWQAPPPCPSAGCYRARHAAVASPPPATRTPGTRRNNLIVRWSAVSKYQILCSDLPKRSRLMPSAHVAQKACWGSA